MHYLPRKSNSDLLLTRLLPFSTSNPLGLGRLRLVYQYRDSTIPNRSLVSSDSDLFLTRLLPFSTSNPLGLSRLRLIEPDAGGY